LARVIKSEEGYTLYQEYIGGDQWTHSEDLMNKMLRGGSTVGKFIPSTQDEVEQIIAKCEAVWAIGTVDT
jgi:hypothetical protein